MQPFYHHAGIQIFHGDCLEVLRTLAPESVQCCVTSPPYWGLRDYGTATWEGGSEACDHLVRTDPRIQSSTLGGGKATTGHQREGFKGSCPRCGAVRLDSQLGLEATPDEYIGNMVDVFREVRRVLRDDGTLWLNMGDSYSGGMLGRNDTDVKNLERRSATYGTGRGSGTIPPDHRQHKVPERLKPKDLVGIPWMLAFALRADGWYLRSDIIWAKPNPMPESVTDRPTKSHEYLFLLSKSERYFYDADAIAEEALRPEGSGNTYPYEVPGQRRGENANLGGGLHEIGPREMRNKRSVWTVTTQPFPEAHFATFPEDLIKPCILAGAGHGSVVLDPFFGAGTTGLVARNLHCSVIGIELNADYIGIAVKRLAQGVLQLEGA